MCHETKSGECLGMPDERVRAQNATIKSELSHAKGLLSDLEDTIKSVEQDLDSISQTILSPSTPNGTPYLKSVKKNSSGATYISGGKPQKAPPLSPDLAKTVNDLSDDLRLIGSHIASLLSLTTKLSGSTNDTDEDWNLVS